jgi:hypothetical protein
MAIIPEFMASFLKKTPSGGVVYFSRGFNKPGYLIDKLYIKKYVLLTFMMKLSSLLMGWIFMYLMFNNKVGAFGLSIPLFVISYLIIALIIIFLPFYIGVKLLNKQYKIIAQNHSEMLDADIKTNSPFGQKPWLNFMIEVLLWVSAFVIVSKLITLPYKIVSALAFIIMVGYCLNQISRISFSNWPERKA